MAPRGVLFLAGVAAAATTPSCVPHTGTCTREYRPRCGKNGVTYANSCLAHNACQADAAEGACSGPSPSPPPSLGDCTVDASVVCTMEYRPRCGKDSKTYGNRCMADAACQLDSTEGECPNATQPKAFASATQPSEAPSSLLTLTSSATTSSTIINLLLGNGHAGGWRHARLGK